jgi:glyoxylase-like metal-dependent hydrolase (beta-lactamase superfamily II)
MMDTKAGIKTLVLEMEAGSHPFVVHTALLWDEHGVVLVDTGLPGQLALIGAAMEKEGLPLELLAGVVITHQDRDHIGSLPEIVASKEGRVRVLAHELAVPYLSGDVPLIKSGQKASPVHVDVALQDGTVLPIAGGLQVVHTPGHTPDHISLYHIPSRTLIAGDALTAQDGVLLPFNPGFTQDHALAARSIAKLMTFEIDTVIAYHGGVASGGIKERLQEIVRELELSLNS